MPRTFSRISPEPGLVDYFNLLYSVVPAETDELVKESFRLRYQVYCIENEFEKPSETTHQMETDEFDNNSAHSIIKYNKSGQSIGSVRMVLPNENDPSRSFPIQRICSHSIFTDRKFFSQNRPVEISRFCLSKSLRTIYHSCDHRCLQLATSAESLPMILLNKYGPILGLIRGLVQMSMEHQVTHWFAIMEASLIRLLARLGIYFKPTGTLINYHGMRQPCHIEFSELLRRVYSDQPHVWEVITDNGSLLNATGGTNNLRILHR
ncbi:PEP-CTERM/exosortase system-associated acyltransferase [Geobacter hydrogenophilus]|uniref:PEP-CTERM/exosortase system-associated acyltransferase n=1 Tax=Geobacter hydrogenophilus TaxID=40983 RepID=UPI001BD9F963|nr:PEP-CTERM/exosortase system-associated acyltransferase [Geobacter hydrogenophilus]MBT0895755.1 PEP-CTERM/exosortase system-associated acyltransferase [Geobacter hydrogenophilus]